MSLDVSLLSAHLLQLSVRKRRINPLLPRAAQLPPAAPARCRLTGAFWGYLFSRTLGWMSRGCSTAELPAPPTDSFLFTLLFESVIATLTCQKQEERKDLTVWAEGIRQTTPLSRRTKKGKISYKGNDLETIQMSPGSEDLKPLLWANFPWSSFDVWVVGARGAAWQRWAPRAPVVGDATPGAPAAAARPSTPRHLSGEASLLLINSWENSILAQMERFFIIESQAGLQNRQINLNEMGILFCFCNSLPCRNQ